MRARTGIPFAAFAWICSARFRAPSIVATSSSRRRRVVFKLFRVGLRLFSAFEISCAPPRNPAPHASAAMKRRSRRRSTRFLAAERISSRRPRCADALRVRRPSPCRGNPSGSSRRMARATDRRRRTGCPAHIPERPRSSPCRTPERKDVGESWRSSVLLEAAPQIDLLLFFGHLSLPLKTHRMYRGNVVSRGMDSTRVVSLAPTHMHIHCGNDRRVFRGSRERTRPLEAALLKQVHRRNAYLAEIVDLSPPGSFSEPPASLPKVMVSRAGDVRKSDQALFVGTNVRREGNHHAIELVGTELSIAPYSRSSSGGAHRLPGAGRRAPKRNPGAKETSQDPAHSRSGSKLDVALKEADDESRRATTPRPRSFLERNRPPPQTMRSGREPRRPTRWGMDRRGPLPCCYERPMASRFPKRWRGDDLAAKLTPFRSKQTSRSVRGSVMKPHERHEDLAGFSMPTSITCG